MKLILQTLLVAFLTSPLAFACDTCEKHNPDKVKKCAAKCECADCEKCENCKDCANCEKCKKCADCEKCKKCPEGCECDKCKKAEGTLACEKCEKHKKEKEEEQDPALAKDCDKCKKGEDKEDPALV